MALGHFQKRIMFNRRRAAHLHRVAARRHFRAALLAKRALAAKQKGHHVRARNLLRRALRVKAMATRAGVRARLHRARIARIRLARLRHRTHHR